MQWNCCQCVGCCSLYRTIVRLDSIGVDALNCELEEKIRLVNRLKESKFKLFLL